MPAPPSRPLQVRFAFPPLRFPRVLSGWEKQGVIRAYTLDLDPLQLGHHILAYIHLDMQPTQKEEFYPFIAACSNVLECNCVTGNYSMLIKVSFASTQELDGFIGRLQKFGKTETQIVFSSPVPPRAIVV